MGESDHVLASRRRIEKADGNGRGDDPFAQVSLALAEALLAVAAAIDRLSAVLSGPDRPKLSAARGSAEYIAEIRRRYPSAYTPWTAEADAALLAGRQAGHDIATLADTFGRQPSAIRSRLQHLS
ncbi:MAG TPA: hypothetical protein VN840_03530 [Streptosporangiaceae bacterium]|nr:hypothetical protein [Streptosporangiaceae bacterium]